MRPTLALLACLVLPSPALAGPGDSHVINDSRQTTALDCAARPEVVLNGSRNKVTVTGACTKVVINGARNVVTIASAARLEVNGAKNEVAVDAVGTLLVTGAKNSITWKKALGTAKSPPTSDLGKDNRIQKAP